MGIRWKDFQMPKRLECEEPTYSDAYGKFIAEPFERGYGVTIGNSLRRIMISSIEGAAITSIKIDGVLHEFSAIPGVVEDVPQIILNIKKITIKSSSRSPKVIHIKIEKKGDVTAGDIITDETIEILNPEVHIATLTEKTKLHIEMEVGKGRGYVPAERNKKEGQAIGVIPIDSVFAPVKNVNFYIENTRVGQITEYDRLILEISTNRSVSPKEALIYASHILEKHLDIFVNYGEISEEDEPEESEEDTRVHEKLKQPISELELSVRSANCLKDAKIKTIGELVKKTEMEMLKYRNFGKKSLSEITDILKTMNLSLGMKTQEKVKN